MVKQFILILFTAFSACGFAYADLIDITAEIQQDGAYENQPLKGTITVTHPNTISIDTNSFLIGNDKLSANFVKDVRIDPSNPTLLSIYNFQLPGKPQGLYALPEISVNVGGKTYHTIMSTYSVQPNTGRSAAPPPQRQTAPQPSPEPSVPTANPPADGQPSLRLEAGVDGPPTLYPGQVTRFFYKYYFSGNIGLTKEEIPLLDAEGFIKIGEKEFKNNTEGNLSVTEISQVVRAVKPGKYTFGPSQIEGHAYKNDTLGNPVYTSGTLSSIAPIVAVTVLPFPEKTKPASFNGAVGNFTFKTELVSSPKVEVGDDLTLNLIISGKGNLKELTTPDLCCQPGLSGFFQQGDLPPKETANGDTKTVTVQLRILNDKPKEIPSIEFSYFDPDLSSYTTLHSDPIPITIKGTPPPSPGAVPPPKPSSKEPKPPQANLSATAPIEIESIMPLRSNDLYNLKFGTWWALAALPIGLALLAFQVHLKDYLAWRRSQVIPVTSKDLFTEAFTKKGQCNFQVLDKAFRLALVESGQLPPGTPEDKELPSTGLNGEVKNLLAFFDEGRFSGRTPLSLDEVRKQSDALYAKIMAAAKKEAGNVK